MKSANFSLNYYLGLTVKNGHNLDFLSREVFTAVKDGQYVVAMNSRFGKGGLWGAGDTEKQAAEQLRFRMEQRFGKIEQFDNYSFVVCLFNEDGTVKDVPENVVWKYGSGYSKDIKFNEFRKEIVEQKSVQKVSSKKEIVEQKPVQKVRKSSKKAK